MFGERHGNIVRRLGGDDVDRVADLDRRALPQPELRRRLAGGEARDDDVVVKRHAALRNLFEGDIQRQHLGDRCRQPRRIGLARAQELTYTARTVGGREAAAIGLVNWCAADADFDADVERTARSILANSWFSLRANKRLYRETDGLPLRVGLSHEILRSEGRGPDMEARIGAFMNKTAKLST